MCMECRPDVPIDVGQLPCCPKSEKREEALVSFAHFHTHFTPLISSPHFSLPYQPKRRASTTLTPAMSVARPPTFAPSLSVESPSSARRKLEFDQKPSELLQKLHPPNALTRGQSFVRRLPRLDATEPRPDADVVLPNSPARKSLDDPPIDVRPTPQRRPLVRCDPPLPPPSFT
jgi:hypothetical protein